MMHADLQVGLGLAGLAFTAWLWGEGAQEYPTHLLGWTSFLAVVVGICRC